MARMMGLRFLGTSSQTNVTRNCSSLLVKVDHQTVMVDCGESTQRQLQNAAIGGGEKLTNIRHILVTHLHADHVLGIVPLLLTMLGPTGNPVPEFNQKTPRVEIYGPSGLRALIRSTLTLCYSQLSGAYTVHELLWKDQAAYPNELLSSSDGSPIAASLPEAEIPLPGAKLGARRFIPYMPLHENELPGMDFRMDDETLTWPHITSIEGVTISAAPILHRCPTLGYVFSELPSAGKVSQEAVNLITANRDALRENHNVQRPLSLIGKLKKERVPVKLPDGNILRPPPLDLPGRKVVVLGDTYDASGGLHSTSEDSERGQPSASSSRATSDVGMLSLARDADVLVHECTNAASPSHLTMKNKPERRDEVRAKALLRGHSTPQVAGAFAANIGARQLLLNHFSTKYPSPFPSVQNDRKRIRNGTIIPLWSNASEAATLDIPKSEKERRSAIMYDIEGQATDAWHSALEEGMTNYESAKHRRAVATFDGFTYEVPRRGTGDFDERLLEGDVDNGEETLSEKGSTVGNSSLDGGERSFWNSSSSSRRGRGGRGRSRPRGYGPGSM